MVFWSTRPAGLGGPGLLFVWRGSGRRRALALPSATTNRRPANSPAREGGHPNHAGLLARPPDRASSTGGGAKSRLPMTRPHPLDGRAGADEDEPLVSGPEPPHGWNPAFASPARHGRRPVFR